MVLRWFFYVATIAFNGFRWFQTIGQTMRWFRWIVVVYYVCNKHLTTSPGKDKDKEEDNYKYEYKRYHEYHEIVYLRNT